MTTQRVPLEALQKIRQHFRSALAVPELENHPELYSHADEPPVPESLDGLGSLFHFGGSLESTPQMPNNQGQWFISVINPGDALMKLPGIRLNPNFRLISYLYRQGKDGCGATWAVPEQCSTTACLEKALIHASGRDAPPRPEGALTDVMAAIEGDHSPMSFVIASIARRELREVGSLGRSASWVHHCLIDIIPNQCIWQWRIEPPKDLSPKVRVFSDGRVAIEFFTCRTVAPIALFQHIDSYLAGQYCAKHRDRAIAIAQVPMHSTNGKKQIF